MNYYSYISAEHTIILFIFQLHIHAHTYEHSPTQSICNFAYNNVAGKIISNKVAIHKATSLQSINEKTTMPAINKCT